MHIAEFSIIVFLGATMAGFLGALTGLGGGVIIVPLLTLVFGADIRYAIGASLVSVIATSSGAAAAYVKKGFSNIRLGMFLEGEPSDLRSVPGIIRDASLFQGRGIIQFGLLLLIATPIMRVAFTVLSFSLQRDRVYVGVTLIVLALLLFSITGGAK